MYLDSFDEAILRVLGKGERGKMLREVVGETGFARSTVISHLLRLEAEGLVRREKLVKRGRGRPKYLYHTLKIPPRWGFPTGTNNLFR
jgi:predicted ArsR family transcriptional regulator